MALEKEGSYYIRLLEHLKRRLEIWREESGKNLGERGGKNTKLFRSQLPLGIENG